MAGGAAVLSPPARRDTWGGGETKIKWEITRLVREGTVRWGCERERDRGRTNKTVIRVKKWGASAAKNTKERGGE